MQQFILEDLYNFAVWVYIYIYMFFKGKHIGN